MGCTQIKALEIIDDLYSSETVTRTLKKHSVDTKSFFKLVASVPLITETYIRAQEIRADLFADMVVEESRSAGDPHAVRNRMNALIWAASKMKPDKYGDRLDVSITQTVDIRGALEAAKNRIREVIEVTKTQLLDNATTIVDRATGLKPDAANEEALESLDDLLS